MTGMDNFKSFNSWEPLTRLLFSIIKTAQQCGGEQTDMFLHKFKN